jgi:hypothetical protein
MRGPLEWRLSLSQLRCGMDLWGFLVFNFNLFYWSGILLFLKKILFYFIYFLNPNSDRIQGAYCTVRYGTGFRTDNLVIIIMTTEAGLRTRTNV